KLRCGERQLECAEIGDTPFDYSGESLYFLRRVACGAEGVRDLGMRQAREQLAEPFCILPWDIAGNPFPRTAVKILHKCTVVKAKIAGNTEAHGFRRGLDDEFGALIRLQVAFDARLLPLQICGSER